MWSDKRLAWDKNEFNVEVLRMHSGEVWRPDTTLYNRYIVSNIYLNEN